MGRAKSLILGELPDIILSRCGPGMKIQVNQGEMDVVASDIVIQVTVPMGKDLYTED